MVWQFNPYAVPLFLCALPLTVVAVIVWQRRSDQSARYFFWFTLLILLLVVSYGFELLSADLPSMLFWLRWEYLGAWGLVFLLLFMLAYTGHDKGLTRLRVAGLFVIPTVVLALVWTNDSHGLIWATTGIGLHEGLAFFDRTYGPAFWMWLAYIFALMAAVIIVGIQSVVRAPAIYRRQLLPLVLGGFIPWIGASLTVARLTPVPYLDLTPYTVALMWVPMAYSLLRFRLLDLIPVAHDLIVHGLRDGVFVLNERGQVAEANCAAEHFTGQTADQLIGRSLWDVLEGVAEITLPALDAADLHVEVIRDENGSSQYLDLHISALQDWRGHSRGHIVSIRDVTARRLAEQQAAQLTFERERIRILSDFIRDASHEFRTPLTVIQSAARVLSKIDDPQMRQNQTARILEQSNSILHLVEDLVQMTRLDSVRTLPRAPVDLNAVVSMAVQDARVRYQDRRINFRLDLNPALPAAQASETDLYLALCKLIANAVRYSPVGADVTVCTGSSAGSLFIEVRDCGSGIMPQDLARVFERFYRADEAHTTSGFGLGLPIAQRVANLHGGSIDIQSVPNAGSTFTLWLPTTLTQ